MSSPQTQTAPGTAGDAATPEPLPLLRRLHPLLPMVAPYRRQVMLAGLFLLLAAGTTLSVPLAFRAMIDAGFTPEVLNQRFLTILILALLLAITTSLRFYMMSWLGERVTADLRARVYDNVVRQPPAFFENLKTGEVLSRLTADTTLVQTLVGTSVSMALRNTILLIGGLVMMIATSAWLAGLMVVLLLIVILPLWAFGRRVRKLSRESQDSVANASALAGETLGAISTVQAYVRETYEQNRFAHAVETAFEAARRRMTMRAWLTASAITLSFGMIVVTLWIGAGSIASGQLGIGQLTQFVLYAAFVGGAIGSLSEVWGDLQRAVGATERLVELLQARDAEVSAGSPRTKGFSPAVADLACNIAARASTPELMPADVQAPRHETASGTDARVEPLIAFDNVTFCYPSRPSQPALSGLTLEIGHGEKIAIVGPSGAGKSSLFNLLLRFHPATAGSIRIAGHPLEEWNRDRLRESIGLVAQDATIFSASALENIRYGRLDASDEDVTAAARAAHADEFIRTLPDGYDTFLGERGVRLSGGQRQRIAIARALLKSPPILLLDEATSALDAESERMVQEALESLLPGRTALIIAHRLATIRHADRIVVLQHGRIVEVGQHDELVAQGGLYARLAAMQFDDGGA